MLGDEIETDVGTPAAGGGFVGKAPDGRVVFVRHAIQGERVRALITEETSSYLRADAIEILLPSPHRVTTRCPHAGPGRCGGCDWQHVDLTQQRNFKATRISEQLARIAGVNLTVSVEPVHGDIDGLGWRTRIGFGVDEDGSVGLHRYRSAELEHIEHCPLASPAIEQLGIESEQWNGVREVGAFVSPTGGGATIDLLTTNRRVKALPQCAADLVVDGKPRTGNGRVQVTVLGRSFAVSAGVFWQVHPGAATILGRAVLDAVGEVTGQQVIDLYCGAGLFTALLGQAVGPSGSVLGIERDRRACEDARRNTADLTGVTILQSSITAKALNALDQRPVTIVLDPSREGAGRQVMAALTGTWPELRRMIYVSCDPATFARDVHFAQEGGWTLQSLLAYDLFPMTEHVELVGVLTPNPVV